MRSSGCGAGAEARFALAKHPRSVTEGAETIQQLADLHAARVGGDVGARGYSIRHDGTPTGLSSLANALQV